MYARAWWIVTAAVLVTACAGIPRDDGEVSSLDRHLAYADDPVDNFTYHARIHGWSLVDRHHLVVWAAGNRAYLLSVDRTCMGLSYANRIELSSRVGFRTVTSRLDDVQLDRERCRIMEIRPLDEERMRADARAAAAD